MQSRCISRHHPRRTGIGRVAEHPLAGPLRAASARASAWRRYATVRADLARSTGAIARPVHVLLRFRPPPVADAWHRGNGGPGFHAADGDRRQRAEAATIEDEICQGGIESDRPIAVALRPILSTEGGDSVAARRKLSAPAVLDRSCGHGNRPTGVYDRVRPRRTRAAKDPNPTRTTPLPAPPADRVDVFRETGRQRQPLHRDYALVLDSPGTVVITLTPVVGKAILCGALLEPCPAKGD